MNFLNDKTLLSQSLMQQWHMKILPKKSEKNTHMHKRFLAFVSNFESLHLDSPMLSHHSLLNFTLTHSDSIKHVVVGTAQLLSIPYLMYSCCRKTGCRCIHAIAWICLKKVEDLSAIIASRCHRQSVHNIW